MTTNGRRTLVTLLAVLLMPLAGCTDGSTEATQAPATEATTPAAPATTATTAPRAIEMELVCSDSTSDGSRHQVNLGDYNGSVTQAKRALCPVVEQAESGSIERPLKSGAAEWATYDYADGAQWTYAVRNVTVYAELEHPDITFWLDSQPLQAGDALVAIDMKVDHLAGPPADNFVPADVSVLDGNRLIHERVYWSIQWADGAESYAPDIPVGTTGEWRVIVPVPTKDIDGMVVMVTPWGSEPTYFAP